MTKEKKVFLDIDQQLIQEMQNYESSSVMPLTNLRKNVELIMGNVDFNYTELIEHGTSYLVNTFVSKYMPNSPSHLDHAPIVEAQTKVSLKKVTAAIQEYRAAIVPLGELKPTINNRGYQSTNLEPSKFKRYLNPAKAEYYKYLTNLLPLILQNADYNERPNQIFVLEAFIGKAVFTAGGEIMINNLFFST